MRRHSAFANEGLWWFVACALIAVLIAKFIGPWYALPMLLPMAFLVALFQDPVRQSPLRPRAVLAPCDGRVIAIEKTRSGLLDRESLRAVIRVNPLGAYTIRAPVEGLILDPRDNVREGSKMTGRGGMWLRTDEGDDVVVTFAANGWLTTPLAFRRYGERVGHGHRCGFLRLARFCEIYMPADALPRVSVGDRVLATTDALAELRSKRGADVDTVADSDSSEAV